MRLLVLLIFLIPFSDAASGYSRSKSSFCQYWCPCPEPTRRLGSSICNICPSCPEPTTAEPTTKPTTTESTTKPTTTEPPTKPIITEPTTKPTTAKPTKLPTPVATDPLCPINPSDEFAELKDRIEELRVDFKTYVVHTNWSTVPDQEPANEPPTNPTTSEPTTKLTTAAKAMEQPTPQNATIRNKTDELCPIEFAELLNSVEELREDFKAYAGKTNGEPNEATQPENGATTPESTDEPTSTANSSEPAANVTDLPDAVSEPSTGVSSTSAPVKMSVINVDMNSADQQKIVLDKHNELRQSEMIDAEGNTYKAKLGNLTWDDEIAEFALERATHMSEMGDNDQGCNANGARNGAYQDGARFLSGSELSNSLTHNGVYHGENVAKKLSGSPIDTPDFSTRIFNWWNKHKAFYYQNGTYEGDASCKAGYVCDHFTQVMWNATTKLGCGAAACPLKEGRGSGYHSYVLVCLYAPGGNIYGDQIFEKA